VTTGALLVLAIKKFMKFAGIVEYDGSDFCGWQRQSHVPSVQEAVERAISLVANHEVGIACAGRTDSGVHSLGQVMHFETKAQRELRSWLLGINSNLPRSVVLKSIKLMPEDFHARFSARSRSYRYIISNQSVRPALLANRAAWEYEPLDAALMQTGANYLVGEHDYTSFRALACQAHSPVREILNLSVQRDGALVIIDVTANGFLHHMVRNLAGVLMSIGKSENPPEWAQQVLMKKDRACGGVTAKAQGLYFMRVQYDSKYQI
jgi:tRNA pseudouridine38-40 synthase